MDYSIYDAIKAGFGKIVFVIRTSFEQDFKDVVVNKFKDLIDTDIVFQEISKVPVGTIYTPEREKPWGTNHAVLMGKEAIKEPFAVINADDFYGQESFAILADFLRSVEGKKNEYCMIGYRVGNTLSESGSVSRGVCVVDENDLLLNVVERTSIEEKGGKINFLDENGEEVTIEKNTPVSMNMWGFTPDYFDYSEEYFKEFLAENGQKLKSEFYIPLAVNNLIIHNKVTCKVLDTPSKWFGVTYADDRSQVVLKINELVRKGVYPSKLFK
jgi:UTP-glucose-1-phosphate uridylyltransferase